MLLTEIFYSHRFDQATNETNVNIPQMADTLFERTANSSWVVVFKALVTTHHLMVHGNEVKFINPGFLFGQGGRLISLKSLYILLIRKIRGSI